MAKNKDEIKIQKFYENYGNFSLGECTEFFLCKKVACMSKYTRSEYERKIEIENLYYLTGRKIIDLTIERMKDYCKNADELDRFILEALAIWYKCLYENKFEDNDLKYRGATIVSFEEAFNYFIAPNLYMSLNTKYKRTHYKLLLDDECVLQNSEKEVSDQEITPANFYKSLINVCSDKEFEIICHLYGIGCEQLNESDVAEYFAMDIDDVMAIHDDVLVRVKAKVRK